MRTCVQCVGGCGVHAHVCVQCVGGCGVCVCAVCRRVWCVCVHAHVCVQCVGGCGVCVDVCIYGNGGSMCICLYTRAGVWKCRGDMWEGVGVCLWVWCEHDVCV